MVSNFVSQKSFKMKKRSLSGNIGIGVFLVGFVCVCTAFCTSAWLVSDYRITGAKLNQLGLWRHCFRSLPNPIEPDALKRFFVGCRWIYDPFTAGYSEIRGFLLPPFMVVTQVFFTLCFISCFVAFCLILLFGLCSYPEQKRYVDLILLIGLILLVGGVSGILAVIVFGSLGNGDGWMPGHETNYFGWSFVLAAIGVILILISGLLFIIEGTIQRKKRNYLRESQTRFQLESKS